MLAIFLGVPDTQAQQVSRQTKPAEPVPEAAPNDSPQTGSSQASSVTTPESLTLLAPPAARPGNTANQAPPMSRLPRERFDVNPPTERVTGDPGDMHTRKSTCLSLPTAETRQRIVDVAVQEWAFFGFPVRDETVPRPRRARRPTSGDAKNPPRRRFRGGDPVEGERVAASIGGYWAVTPEGFWIVDEQNKDWTGRWGLGARWNAPWSAAFISWVMCEGGLGNPSQFKRAVAHVTYIDQAIRARDGKEPSAAFTAYDIGEQEIEPGDLLCSARRPAFKSIAERRRQMGEGGRSHCDVVVKVDAPNARLLTVGGNVGGKVSMKIMRTISRGGGIGPDGNAIFAHLKLHAPGIASNALDHSPTLESQTCPANVVPGRLLTMHLLTRSEPGC